MRTNNHRLKDQLDIHVYCKQPDNLRILCISLKTGPKSNLSPKQITECQNLTVVSLTNFSYYSFSY